MDDRTILITSDDLTKNPIGAMLTILSVMLYPENEKAREAFIESWVLCDFGGSSAETRAAFLKEESEYAAKLFEKTNYAQKLSSTVHARKAGGFSLYRKGILSGHTLMHLLNPSVSTLENAYDKVRKRFDQNREQVELIYNSRSIPEKHRHGKPTKAILRSIWREYKHASHLWAADSALYFSEGGGFLSQDWFEEGLEGLTSSLPRFLGIASYIRARLIDSTNPYTRMPHVDNAGLNVWNIVNERQRPYAPLKVFFENF